MVTTRRALSCLVIFAAVLAVQLRARPDQAVSASIESPKLRIEFDKNMRSRVIARFGGKDIPLGGFTASETVKGSAQSWTNFALKEQSREHVADLYGTGQKLTLTGVSGPLEKSLSVTIYDAFPDLAVFDVNYSNMGKAHLEILGWDNNHYTINAGPNSSQPPFWSFQSGSYEKRPNWIVPLHAGFSQQNYLGMNASDYGGGTPIVDVWRKDAGIAVGHLELPSQTDFLAGFHAECPRSAGGSTRSSTAVARVGRDPSYFEDLCGRPPGRLLRDPAYLSQLHVEAGLPDGESSERRLRRYLVRLGLWPQLQAPTGVRHASHGEAAWLYLGHPG